jgi:3-methylcrotonyl-CoA carboxylase alpha subunit
LRVAINNRGEVALRIIRACQELGHTSILFHSTPDKGTPAYRLADERFELPGDSALATYLKIPSVVEAAVKTRAEMLHPGFGFLSENADFAEALTGAGIRFVGPDADTIRLSGNKIRAKGLAQKAGVPVTPAFTGSETDPKKLLAEARKIGFPCIVKAASGGGGKGMKVVRKDSEFFELLSSAQREAKAAFGSDVVFIEKYLENPRHVEVQIIGDTHGNRLHFFERDCSVQRRHQKIFEETPSGALTPELRQKITDAALKIAEHVGYVNAGTVEFLLDGKNNFYFMELNTRLQVEHTVTEMACGVDFVHLQFSVAEGKALPLKQEEIQPRGHALEVRVYAEDPTREFLPSTGEIAELKLPQGPHRRFDFGFEAGDAITPFYDPMIGKIITWSSTRAENLKRMHATLCDTVVFGVHTNIEFLKSVLGNEKFVSNKFGTRFLEEEFGTGYKPPALTSEQKTLLAELQKTGVMTASSGHLIQSSAGGPLRFRSPWAGS